ncbi:MAG: TIGR03086 family protein [Chloroflexi bacterium]|nr:TIGR03086 family protein [Chloroflexota bacterium]
MTQQAVTNPVALFETATKHARKVMTAVKPDQLAKPTPCAEWNVQQLMSHLVDATAYITHILSGQPEQAPSGNSPVERFDAGAASVLKEARRPGALEKTVKGPMGEMPGSAALMMGLGDIVVHGWDVAKATGQDTRIDPQLVQTCLSFYTQALPPTGIPGAFSPPAQVPANASPQDRLIAATGRRP